MWPEFIFVSILGRREVLRRETVEKKKKIFFFVEMEDEIYLFTISLPLLRYFSASVSTDFQIGSSQTSFSLLYLYYLFFLVCLADGGSAVFFSYE